MSMRPTVGRVQGFPNPVCRTTHLRGPGSVATYPQYAPGVVSDARQGQQLLAYGPRTALVVVDVQNDFADPSGSLSVPGAQGVVDKANAEIAAARAAGA